MKPKAATICPLVAHAQERKCIKVMRGRSNIDRGMEVIDLRSRDSICFIASSINAPVFIDRHASKVHVVK